MKNKLYVAYGSNLNIKQMSWRCPDCKLVNTGKIDGYQLQFKGSSNSAFATISANANSSVPVAVWSISSNDEMALDRYEGFPSHYFKKDVLVTMDNEIDYENPIVIRAMVYIMNPKMKFGIPSPSYYNTILDGYRMCGLDAKYLKNAMAESVHKYLLNPWNLYAVRYNYSPKTLQAKSEIDDTEPIDDNQISF